MSDDLQIKAWNWKDRIILWGVAVLTALNVIIGLLTLGPDILHW